MFKYLRVVWAFAVVALLFPSVASASDVAVPHSLVLPTDQIWAFVAGNLAPLIAYLLNYAGPWLSEKIKLFVQLVVAAVAGGVAQAITAGGVGFNDVTLQFVITAVVGALLAHKWAWQPSSIASSLGGGRNRQQEPAQ